ncbi:unnamed protein product [Brugia pahangi]|uniref:Uncharacterized protein n=1 Tax=Brugia pahangi TaxID=6280 RepID=A0A0N4T1K3_BRUPA|nr:unnamed protein product [Brugia pahangi]
MGGSVSNQAITCREEEKGHLKFEILFKLCMHQMTPYQYPAQSLSDPPSFSSSFYFCCRSNCPFAFLMVISVSGSSNRFLVLIRFNLTCISDVRARKRVLGPFEVETNLRKYALHRNHAECGNSRRSLRCCNPRDLSSHLNSELIGFRKMKSVRCNRPDFILVDDKLLSRTICDGDAGNGNGYDNKYK